MTGKYFGALCLAAPLSLVIGSTAMAQETVFVPGTGQPLASLSDDDYTPSLVADESGVDDVAEAMSDARLRDDVSNMVERATGTILNIPIGRFADAIERARPGTVDRRLDRNATVADLAGVDPRRLPEELGDRSRETIDMLSGFARAMAAMMPEIRRMGDELEDSFREIGAD